MANNKKKEPKRKPKYGMFSCVGYIYRLLWNTERRLVFTAVCTVPISVLLSAVTLYTPTLILRALENADRFSYIALVILGLLLAGLLMELADNALKSSISYSDMYVLNRMMYLFQEKKRYRDYYHSYQEEAKTKDTRADAAITNNHTRGVNFPMDFAQMTASLLKFLLFGTVVSALHPAVILLLAAGSALTFALSLWQKKANWQDADASHRVWKKIAYFQYGTIQESAAGKDIRLYTMNDFLRRLTGDLVNAKFRITAKMEGRALLVSAADFLIILVRDGLAYAYLIHRAVTGSIDAASFVLYFSAIGSLSAFMTEILQKWADILQGALEISDFREDLEIEDRLNRGEGIPVPTKSFSIEFKNVSFRYPATDGDDANAQSPAADGDGTGPQTPAAAVTPPAPPRNPKVLDNVSFRIEPGEKIALVGLNGAGKTTLTLLMCGLLLPDEGEILLDGHSLFEYNREQLYGLFGFVPQNYNLLPISISRNIACTLTEEEIDREKLRRCIDLSGLTEKIAALPQGVQTPLNRRVNPQGAEFSGGEVQKLLLARLLYKNPLCIILDEPTAALDPLAEHRMYCKYNEIAANATSVFISHRLASTRFCDRIFFLDGAHFAEEGTHDALMEAGGKYRELFDVQSKYYKEGVRNDEE